MRTSLKRFTDWLADWWKSLVYLGAYTDSKGQHHESVFGGADVD